MYNKYVERLRNTLRGLPRGSKRWWSVSHALRSGNNWYVSAEDKAGILQDTFSSKFLLPTERFIAHSFVFPVAAPSVSFLPLRLHSGVKVLSALRTDSGNGPDVLSATILHCCASSLDLPFTMLWRRILQEGVWPDTSSRRASVQKEPDTDVHKR